MKIQRAHTVPLLFILLPKDNLHGEFTMYKISNKSIAVLAVFAMMFAGFGAILVAGANDAAEVKTADLFNGDEDVLYVVDDTGAAAVIADLAPYEAIFGEGNVEVVDVGVKFTYKTHGEPAVAYTYDDIPTIYKPYVDDSAKVIFAEEKATFDTVMAALGTYVAPVANSYGFKIVCHVETENAIVTPEEAAEVLLEIATLTAAVEAAEEEIADLEADIADLEAAIDAKEAEIAELEAYIAELEDDTEGVIAALRAVIEEAELEIADLEADIDAKNAKIAELEKKVADDKALIEEKDAKIADLEEQLAKKSDGNATVAWCVAAVGIIAAIVLAGFVLIVFMKAKKEGRRLL